MKRSTLLLRNGLGMAVLGVVALGTPGTSAEPADVPNMASAERFALIMDGAAVKDAMTGLIWEQSPDSFMEYGANRSPIVRTRQSAARKGGACRQRKN